MILRGNVRLWCLSAISCLCFVSGCGSGEVVVEIGGVVTYQGKPVKEGLVQLSHVDTGRVAEVAIGSEGAYSAEVLVGKHRVVVMPMISNRNAKDPNALPDYGSNEAKDIPEIYRNTNTSPLQINVEKTSKKFDFPLSNQK